MGAQIDPATIAGYFQPECKRINLGGHAYPLNLWRIEIMKTSELIGPALNWVVEFIEGGCKAEPRANYWLEKWVDPERRYLCGSPSTDWAQGGPIMERKGISPLLFEGQWFAFSNLPTHDCIDDIAEGYVGPTPLIAAMRCYVASKLGDEIELPEELK